MEGCVYFHWPFPWRKVLTGESIFNFTWGKSFALNDKAQSSYHDWHSNSRRGSPWPPRNHRRPVPACPDEDLENHFTLDDCCCFLHQQYEHWHAEPNHRVLGTTISIFYLHFYILVAWSVPTFGCLAALWEIKVRPAEPGVSSQVAGGNQTCKQCLKYSKKKPTTTLSL